ncbi:hypothetical protein JHK86_043042 [Glycine max]|nr:hypothetical protein JHK86_043042 [Glycine max]
MDNHSWCYPSCIQCYKKTDVYPEPFVCPCGKHNDRAVLRHVQRLKLQHRLIPMILSTMNLNMENHRFISKSDSTKAKSNRKHIRQQKVHLDVQHSVHASLNPASSHTEDDYNQPKTPPHSVHATVDRAPHDAEDHCALSNLCCGDDKIELSLLQNTPKFLQHLLFEQNTAYAKNYQQNIRTYNMMFAFTSASFKFDKTIGHSRGPPTIKIQGQPCHRIGSLLPMPGKEPKFAQLYIYETENEVQNRINIMR